jgi:hypothetical protein
MAIDVVGANPVATDIFAEAFFRPTIVALASGWATAAAFDLESKWSEIGFGTVTVTDARNFAHGRHYGLSQRLEHTLVLGLVTHHDASTLERTLKRLPRTACTAVLHTSLDNEAGAIDLLAQVIRLTGQIGARRGIDPGRPSVPAFGRALYRAGIPLSTFGRNGTKRRALAQRAEDLWIRRKVSPALWESAGEATREVWRARCRAWTHSAESTAIGGVVLDYDGTLCEVDERFGTPAVAVGDALARLVNAGLCVGIATGRGDSVLTALRAVVTESVWPDIIVGMYNGGHLCRLNERPCIDSDPAEGIRVARTILEQSPLLAELARFRTRPTQLTVHALRPVPDGLLHRIVLETLTAADQHLSVEVVASGHTVDVLARGVSKLRVVDAVRAALPKVLNSTQVARRKRAQTSEALDLHVMTIGDQGQAGGNDGPFLAHRMGLSVENVSSVFDACWNVAPPGARRTAALLGYLDALQLHRSGAVHWSVARASRPIRLANAAGNGSTRRRAL